MVSPLFYTSWMVSLTTLVLLLVACVGKYGPSSAISRLTRQAPTANDKTPSCRRFLPLVNNLTPDGDFWLRMGKRNRTGCQEACLRFSLGYYCAAFHLTHSRFCIISGYVLRFNVSSVHYRRICKVGRWCFNRFPNYISGFHTGFILIPEANTTSELDKADFCRVECQQLVYCKAFDLVEDSPYCFYTEFRPQPHLYANLYLRSCSKAWETVNQD